MAGGARAGSGCPGRAGLPKPALVTTGMGSPGMHGAVGLRDPRAGSGERGIALCGNLRLCERWLECMGSRLAA